LDRVRSFFLKLFSLFFQEFPVTTKTFMPSANCLRRFRDFPAIVSSSNRSGKNSVEDRAIDLLPRHLDARLRVRNRDQVEDIIPILQQIDDYIMVEPLVKAAYELHVTRIGGIYSVYVQTSPQEGNAVVERVEITPRNGCSKRKKIRGEIVLCQTIITDE
jgi:hypothetical protein